MVAEAAEAPPELGTLERAGTVLLLLMLLPLLVSETLMLVETPVVVDTVGVAELDAPEDTVPSERLSVVELEATVAIALPDDAPSAEATPTAVAVLVPEAVAEAGVEVVAATTLTEVFIDEEAAADEAAGEEAVVDVEVEVLVVVVAEEAGAPGV